MRTIRDCVIRRSIQRRNPKMVDGRRNRSRGLRDRRDGGSVGAQLPDIGMRLIEPCHFCLLSKLWAAMASLRPRRGGRTSTTSASCRPRSDAGWWRCAVGRAEVSPVDDPGRPRKVDAPHRSPCSESSCIPSRSAVDDPSSTRRFFRLCGCLSASAMCSSWSRLRRSYDTAKSVTAHDVATMVRFAIRDRINAGSNGIAMWISISHQRLSVAA